MTARLTFTVRGTPVPRPRPRCRAVLSIGKGGKRIWIGQMYQPKGKPPGTPKADPEDIRWWRAHDWHARIIAQAKSTPGFPDTPWEGPIRLWIDAYFERPDKLLGKKHSEDAIPRPSGAGPDRDNLDKAVMDALTEAGLWNDDGQVCAGGEVRMFYAAKGAGPGVVVTAELVGTADVTLFEGAADDRASTHGR